MDKYKLQMAVKFKRDVKMCQKRGLPLDELWTVVRRLLQGETLEEKSRLTCFQATIRANGNVICAPIGYCYGSSTMTN